MIVWRLTTRETIQKAFDGQGASKYGGRWNSKGTKLVYCSESISLAVLENLVYFDVDLAPPLYLYEVEINEKSIHRDSLIKQQIVDEQKSKKYGDDWISRNDTIALEIPSAVVERENNYLLNPGHIDFKNLKITSHSLFDLDARLTKTIGRE